MLNASTPGNSLGNIKQRIIYNRMLGISIAATAIFILGFVLAPTLGAEAHATEDVSAAVSWRNITLSLDPGYNPSTGTSGSGDIDFGEVIPSSIDTSTPGSENYGTQKVVKKTINVTTEGNYYAVYLSVPGTNNSLSVSGDTVREIPAITPASGDSSTTFSTTSWGFAIPYVAGKSSDAFPAPAILSAYDSFLASSSDATANNLTKSGTGSAVYNTGVWAPVPTLANVEQIYKNSTNAVAGFDSGDNFDIYYSIMVDTNTMAGIYENEVIYTAIASSSALDEVSQNVSRSEAEVTSGTIELLQVDLATTNMPSNGIVAGDVWVYLVPHSIIVANNYSVENLTRTDYPRCWVNSISDDNTITCGMPAFNEKGSTDATGAYKVIDGAEYDFWVRVNTPVGEVLEYVSHYKDGNTDVASVKYGVGLQSYSAGGDKLITQMQQMSPSVCRYTTVYDSTKSEKTTFELEDSRDNKTYNVRKLGNDCWMVQNLRFTETSLDQTTTDIDVSKTIAYDELVNSDSSIANSLTDARIHVGVDNNGDPTVWYNYAAATALTITGSSNTSEATHSLCPKNWKLPAKDDFDKKIVDNDIQLGPNKYYFSMDFAPVTGGRYWSGYSNYSNVAWWWTSTAYNYLQRWDPRYATASLSSGIIDNDSRATGDYVRCIAR